jgi:hypothetical protein
MDDALSEKIAGPSGVRQFVLCTWRASVLSFNKI